MGRLTWLIKQNVEDAIPDQEVPGTLIGRQRTALDVDGSGLQGVGDIHPERQELMINVVICPNIDRALTEPHWFSDPCHSRLERRARKKSSPVQVVSGPRIS